MKAPGNGLLTKYEKTTLKDEQKHTQKQVFQNQVTAKIQEEF